MVEGTLEFSVEIRAFDSVSPTRFLSLRQCALREVWATSGGPELLPRHPAARLGSAIHELLREAGERHFVSGGIDSIKRRWQELVAAAEQHMRSTWLERHLVPLEESVSDFEVRRIQAERRALEITVSAERRALEITVSAERRALEITVSAERPHREGHPEEGYGFEIPVSTPDGLVRGRVDAAIPAEKGPTIRDYKSGAIFEPRPKEPLAVKDAYEVQLRIYAALYAVSFGRWPAQLEIVPLSGSAEIIDFDRDACTRLLDQARDTTKRLNETIGRLAAEPHKLQHELAAPSPTTCSHCPYRPVCSPYRTAISASRNELGWPKDAWGRVEEIHQLGNSKAAIVIQTEVGSSRIRGVSSNSSRHPALEQLRAGDDMAAFNLRAGGSHTTFEESPFTVLYKMPRRKEQNG